MDNSRDKASQTKNKLPKPQSLRSLKQRLMTINASDKRIDNAPCTHGIDLFSFGGVHKDFVNKFEVEFNKASGAKHQGGIISCILSARNATSKKYAEVWTDVTKMKRVISYMLYHGTQYVLDDNINYARDVAAVAKYFEQCIAVELNKTQAIIDWTAIDELYEANQHTLIEFIRKGIPCSCLDEKYKEVKNIPKMGRCYNVECTLRRVDHSKMMCCSRCRQITYCSRECQQASWQKHKKFCNNNLAIKAEFDSKHSPPESQRQLICGEA
jgi:hypothetical protein